MWTLIMWHIRFSENENEVWRHIYHDIELPRPKNCNIEKQRQLTHDIVIPRVFSKDKKPRHRNSKAKKPRHRDSKTKKPRY